MGDVLKAGSSRWGRNSALNLLILIPTPAVSRLFSLLAYGIKNHEKDYEIKIEFISICFEAFIFERKLIDKTPKK